MEIKFYGAFVLILRVNLHAIDAPHYPAPNTLVDFHTGKDLRGVGQARDVLRDVDVDAEARRVQGRVQSTRGARDARDRVVLRNLGARRVGEAVEATAGRVVVCRNQSVDVVQVILEII